MEAFLAIGAILRFFRSIRFEMLKVSMPYSSLSLSLSSSDLTDYSDATEDIIRVSLAFKLLFCYQTSMHFSLSGIPMLTDILHHQFVFQRQNVNIGD